MAPYLMHVLNAFLITVILIQVLQPVSGRFGLVDLPHGRKIHDGGVPVIGGVAMFVGLLVPLLAGGVAFHGWWNLIFGLGTLVALGVIDDARDLSAPVKFVVQVIAGLMMTVPDWRVIEHLGYLPLLGLVPLGPLMLPATVLFIVTVINAFNMFDGLDGLAGGTAAIVLISLAVAAGICGHNARLLILLLLLFSVIGFLVFNMRHPWRQRASVFMGDAGSMMLGAAIAFLTIGIVGEPAGSEAPETTPLAAAAWILALPLIDMGSLILRRLFDGRNPMRADRRHIHYLIVDQGISPRATVAILLGIQSVLAAVGVSSWVLGVPEHLLAAALIIPIAAHAVFVTWGLGWVKRSVYRDKRREESLRLVDAELSDDRTVAP